MKLDIELNLSRTVEEALKFAVYKYKMEEKTSREIREVEYIYYMKETVKLKSHRNRSGNGNRQQEATAYGEKRIQSL